MQEMWTYRDEAIGDIDVVGYSVEAVDGGIGKVDEASYDVGAGYVVVDTGPWIFGKKVLLPAGLIDRIDAGSETVYVGCTKDEVKNSPELDETLIGDEEQRTRIGAYYEGTPTYRTTRGTRL
jgi:hypothetical protein